MKKIFLLTLLAISALTLNAQIMMNIGDKKYDISTIDSIVFVKTSVPSINTVLDNSGEYSIFIQALQITGLADSLIIYERDKEYEMASHSDMDGNLLYYPKSCDLGYTLFAEKDEVFRNAGIYNFSDLAAKCVEWYGNPTWYDLISEKGIHISTGADYTYEWNVVHMFVAYHIIRTKIAVDQLVYEKNAKTNDTWNYCFGYEPQVYYETMLQGTLLKVWQTNPKTTKELWLNRYVANNTLTDQYATFGSDGMHQLVYSGAQIDRTGSMEVMNACLHSIDKVLLYDQNACYSQHERMRFHVNQMLPELGTNNFMRATTNEVSALNNGGNGNRIAFPTDYFDNLRCYDENTKLLYGVTGMWRAIESTILGIYGPSDFAIRLPHVPSGRYEIRLPYSPTYRGSKIEFYIGGDSENPSSMTHLNSLNTTLDPNNPEDNENIGYVRIEAYNEEYGIEAEKTMRTHGFMYAPASFSRGTYNTITDKLTITDGDPYSACRIMDGSTNCRTEVGYGTMVLRYIVATADIKQGQDYWFRFKGNAARDDVPEVNQTWSLNFIELVPTDVANNPTYMEDWY